MKKLAVPMLLVLVLALFLAACSNDVADNGDVSSSSVSVAESVPVQDPTGLVVDKLVVPDNGKPIPLNAPLERHAGDKGYFYVRSDDFFVYMSNLDEVELYDAKKYGRADFYCAFFFYWEPFGGEESFEKRVFENSDYAEQYARDKKQENPDLNFVVVENVVYYDGVVMKDADSKVALTAFWRCAGAPFQVSGASR